MYSNPNVIHITKDFYYTLYKVKNRVIFVPCKELKNAQKYFLNAIKWVYPFKTEILKCTRIHTGKKWILKMDIKDFYNSVPTKDIAFVISNVNKRIANGNMFYNFNLVTVNGKLPTGAVTSSHIANACFKKVETDIRYFCSILDVDFTRYVDDLIFSSDEKQILKIVEKRVCAILDFYGYSVNKSKTKYVSNNKQQNVLGLIVNNDKVRLPKKYKKQIRASIHNFIISLSKSENKTPDIKYPVWSEQEYISLMGSLSYIRHVEPDYYKKIKKYYNKLYSDIVDDGKFSIKKPTLY